MVFILEGGNAMTCKEVQDQILRFIDNDIKDKELEEFLKHINECQSCKEELEIYYSLLNGCKQLNSDLEVPDTFHYSLMEKIRFQEKGIKAKKKQNAIKRYASIVAACFILVVGIQAVTLLGDIQKKEDQYTARNVLTQQDEEKQGRQERDQIEGIFQISEDAKTNEKEQNNFYGELNKATIGIQEDSINEETSIAYSNSPDTSVTNEAVDSVDDGLQDTEQPSSVDVTDAKNIESTSDLFKSESHSLFDRDRSDSNDTNRESENDQLVNLGVYIGSFMIVASLVLGAVFFVKLRK